jgi:hypothetical protein
MLLADAAVSAGVVRASVTTPRFQRVLTTPQVSAATTPTVVARSLTGPLDGERTPRSAVLRPPVAAVIDNFYPSARPQSGLSKASLVFETLVEGGITRLMAVYLEHDAGDVGPIRSSRPYFERLAAGYNALFVHAGGSPASVRLLPHLRTLRSIDALAPRPEFRRDTSRVAPDNLYTGTIGVRLLAQRRGVPNTTMPGAVPHGSVSAGTAKPITAIHIDFSTPQISSPAAYAVDYRYDSARRMYARSVGGVPDIDRGVNRPIAVSNVVVMYTGIRLLPNDPSGRIAVRTIGKGRALVFRDGVVTRGTWSKPADSSPLRFLSKGGAPIRLAPGSTWVEIAPNGAARWTTR